MELQGPANQLPKQPQGEVQENIKPDTASILAMTAVAALAAKGVISSTLPDTIDDQKKLKPLDIAAPIDGYRYTASGEVMRKTKFIGTTSTGETQNRFVDLFITINKSPEDVFFYYDAVGQLLLEVKLPEELNKIRAEKGRDEYIRALQTWHNENRRNLLPNEAVTPNDFDSLGYPFVGSAKLPKVDDVDTSEQDTDAPTEQGMIAVVMRRLSETLESKGSKPTYFSGEKLTLFDAITRIAEAYDVPVAVAMGLGANESGFQKDAISKADARGIYQLTKGGFNDAKAFAHAHTEFSKGFRLEPIGAFETDWQNRFVQIELFCAYYSYLMNQLRAPIEKMEDRIRTLDPSFPVGCLREIGVVNAYNAGEGTIKNAIKRFLLLSDEEIQIRIGKPPYGVDVWLSMLAHSFGLKDNDKSSLVGLHVFTYPQKAFALGSLIRSEQNFVSKYDAEKDEPMLEFTDFEDTVNATVNTAKNVLTRIASFVSFASGTTTLVAVKRTQNKEGLTRRNFIKGLVGSVALAVPAAQAAADLLPSFEDVKDTVEADKSIEVDPQLLSEAKAKLDGLYVSLKEYYEKEGRTGLTPKEQNVRRFATINQQRKLLEREFVKMFGEEIFDEFASSKNLSTKDRINLYDRAAAAQEKYVEKQKKSGELVRISEIDGSKPIFPEQVGKMSGTDNDPDSLYMHKDFEWITASVIELMNHQIDAFNANPAIYGIKDPNFPTLPHVTSIKVSGALRDVMQTKKMLLGGQAGRTTKDVSAHWLGLALDIGSFATAGGHMVELKEDLKESKNGKTMVKGGKKLPNGGFGKRTREIYSMMIGRALFSMVGPLRDRGIEIAPLWEPSQLNWHVVYCPKAA